MATNQSRMMAGQKSGLSSVGPPSVSGTWQKFKKRIDKAKRFLRRMSTLPMQCALPFLSLSAPPVLIITSLSKFSVLSLYPPQHLSPNNGIQTSSLSTPLVPISSFSPVHQHPHSFHGLLPSDYQHGKNRVWRKYTLLI